MSIRAEAAWKSGSGEGGCCFVDTGFEEEEVISDRK
jgi:hypothetical protein